MNKKLYKLMNWAAIEEIIYSECDHPQNLLGPHKAGNSTLIQAYYPGAKSVDIIWTSNDVSKGQQKDTMEIADQDGYFAILLPEKNVSFYSYEVTYEITDEKNKPTSKVVLTGDPYRHSDIVKSQDIDLFVNGQLNDAYDFLGCHRMMHEGENGVHFAVWAPNAMRISIVGDFNNWDGRVYQMKRLESGIFELFIPGLTGEFAYQYEIKLKGDRVYKKNDPYAKTLCGGVSFASLNDEYNWKDKAYIRNRKLPSVLRVLELTEDHFVDCKDLGKLIEETVKKAAGQGYTHVQFTPAAMDGGMGINCSNLFALAPEFKNPGDLKLLVDKMHESGIGVLFNWVPAGFGRYESGLCGFDGTCLYEHQDPRQGVSSDGKRLLYQYGKPEVISFLNSNGLYWIKEFHADGICMSSVAQMLYLDYGKNDGEWVANALGGNENLEAIDFIKNFIGLAKSESKSLLMIAEDSSTHEGMTVPVNEGGIGFDYKWNEGFTGEYFNYISVDPIERSHIHNRLVDELVYAYSEKFVLPVSGQMLLNNSGILDLFPGSEEHRKNSLRLSLAYTYTHPGEKLISEFIDNFQSELMAKLNKLSLAENALKNENSNPQSFQWLSNLNAQGCYVSFVRKTDDPEEMLVVVANFAGIENTITTGVPYEGKYKEILNTDDVAFGGSGYINKNTIKATDIQSDGLAQSIKVKLAPLSLSVLKFVAYTEEELSKVIEERIRRNTPIKKSKNK